MPVYEDQCFECDHIWEWYSPHVTDCSGTCPKCGGPGERLFSRYSPKVFAAFNTRNLDPDGREIHVGRQKDLSRYCNEYGVVHCPDPKDAPPKKRAPQPGIDTTLVD
jgi:putative FmdB family regulatory protein